MSEQDNEKADGSREVYKWRGLNMRQKNEMLKLYKILKSSKRVQHIRKLFGIDHDEYYTEEAEHERGYLVRKMTSINNFYICKTVISINGVPSVKFMDTIAEKLIQDEITDFYGLDLQPHEVLYSLLFEPIDICNYILRKGVSPLNNFQISIEFFARPSIQELKMLSKEIDYELAVLEWETSNKQATKHMRKDRNLNTKMNWPKKVKEISCFDEKYTLSREYSRLREEYCGKRIPKDVLSELVCRAAEVFKDSTESKNLFKAEDFRKAIDKFNGYFNGGIRPK